MPITSKALLSDKKASPQYQRLIQHPKSEAIALLSAPDKAIIIHPGISSWTIGQTIAWTSDWLNYYGSVLLNSE